MRSGYQEIPENSGKSEKETTTIGKLWGMLFPSSPKTPIADHDTESAKKVASNSTTTTPLRAHSLIRDSQARKAMYYSQPTEQKTTFLGF